MEDKKPLPFSAPVLGGSKEENLKEPKAESDMEADISPEELSAAVAVKEALNSGDDEDFAMALKNFTSVCGGY